MRGLLSKSLGICALVMGGTTVTLLPAPATAQGSYSPYDESASAALARYIRTLASSPKDFSALIGAGRAALAIGDTQAAAGFFARADEVSPRSPLPQAGMGAVSVAEGEPQAALPYFARAQQLGAPVATFGADRGLAYDLLGQQAQAQADYRAALGGPDGDEARRRLALSLAIGGDKARALETLAPLSARADAAAGRCRAFVLALTGDSNGAMAAFDAAMPGSWSQVAPFVQRIPALGSAQKAAAVNLGIFPDAGDTNYAYAAPRQSYPVATPIIASAVSAERLTDVSELLRHAQPAVAIPAQRPSWQSGPAVQVAYSAPAKRQAKPHKIWLQLASGPNAAALPDQFKRMKSRNRDLFNGITGFVAKSPDRARLVIGPFRGSSDAQIFAQDLESVGIDAFNWTNSESDTIVPLGTE